MAEHILFVVTEAGLDSPVTLAASAAPVKHLRQLKAGNPRRLAIRAAYRIVAAVPARHAAELIDGVRRLFPAPRSPWCPAMVAEADEAIQLLGRHLSRPQQGRLVGAKRGFEAFGAEDLPDRFQISAVPDVEVARWQEQADRDGPLAPTPPRLDADSRMAVDAAVEAVAAKLRPEPPA